MKTVITLLRTTVTGGILFLLPVVISFIIINKARVILLKISAPFKDRLPDLIFGLDGGNLLALVFIFLLCLVSGLLFRAPAVRRAINSMEEHFLSYLPGFAMIKSITSDVIGDTNDHDLVTVLVREEETWRIGFLVEQADDHCTVFLPEAPRHDSGELKIVPASWVKRVNVSTRQATRAIQRYGKGSLSWMEDGKASRPMDVVV